MKATYDETVQMDWLLLDARAVLAEANEIGVGRLVRLTIYSDECFSMLLPWRVAAYARKAMGAPAVVREASKVTFFSKGIAVALLPTAAGYEALVLAVLAYRYALLRRNNRTLRQIAARMRRNQATINRPVGGEGKEAQS